MKTPSAPGDPTLHGRTLSKPGASPSNSTFSRAASPDRTCPWPIAELISHDSSLITNPVILHSALTFPARTLSPDKHISLQKNTFSRSHETNVRTTALNFKFQNETPISCPSLLRIYTLFIYFRGTFTIPHKHISLQKNTFSQRSGVRLPQSFNFEPSTWNYPPQRSAFTTFTFLSACIHDFHANKISPSILLEKYLRVLRALRGSKTSPSLKMSTFPTEVPAITLFNRFYPRPLGARSTSFHQKTPVIPPIPVNSTYSRSISVASVSSSSVISVLLPPFHARMLTFLSQVPDFIVFHRPKTEPPGLNTGSFLPALARLWSGFNTWVTAQVQNIGNTLPTGFGRWSGCHGRRKMS